MELIFIGVVIILLLILIYFLWDWYEVSSAPATGGHKHIMIHPATGHPVISGGAAPVYPTSIAHISPPPIYTAPVYPPMSPPPIYTAQVPPHPLNYPTSGAPIHPAPVAPHPNAAAPIHQTRPNLELGPEPLGKILIAQLSRYFPIKTTMALLSRKGFWQTQIDPITQQYYTRCYAARRAIDDVEGSVGNPVRQQPQFDAKCTMPYSAFLKYNRCIDSICK